MNQAQCNIRFLGPESAGKKTLSGVVIYQCGLELTDLELLERNGVREYGQIVPFFEKEGIQPSFYARHGLVHLTDDESPECACLVVDSTAEDETLTWLKSQIVVGTNDPKPITPQNTLSQNLLDEKIAKEAGKVKRKEISALDILRSARLIVIAINKMDLVDWSEERFIKIASGIKDALNSVVRSNVIIEPVAVAALSGKNITTPSAQFLSHISNSSGLATNNNFTDLLEAIDLIFTSRVDES